MTQGMTRGMTQGMTLGYKDLDQSETLRLDSCSRST